MIKLFIARYLNVFKGHEKKKNHFELIHIKIDKEIEIQTEIEYDKKIDIYWIDK